MVTAAEIAELGAEVQALESYLLGPLNVKPPDPLTGTDRIAVRSYLILAHAAIEEIVEECFSDYVQDTLVLDASGMVDPGVYLTVLELGNDLIGRLKRDDRTPAAVLKAAPQLFVQKICKPNNGVRRRHMQRLAQGAGIDWGNFEDSCATLVQALETLGTKRGSVAHVSGVRAPVGGIAQELYPENVREFVEAALKELPTLASFLGDRPAHTAGTGQRRLWALVRDARSWLRNAWSDRPF